MNERGFKQKLRALIKPYAYIQSMSSLATAGTPDLWISDLNDLWLEVKWDETTKGPIKPKLSALQAAWCNNRAQEGRNVMVLVGVDSKTAILYQGYQELDGGNAFAWNTHSNERRPLKDIVAELVAFVQDK